MEEHREKGSSRRSLDRRGDHRRLEHRRKINSMVEEERRDTVDRNKIGHLPGGTHPPKKQND